LHTADALPRIRHLARGNGAAALPRLYSTPDACVIVPARLRY